MIALPPQDPHSLLLLRAADVQAQLAGRERELIDLVAQAYVTHSQGHSRLPQSEYLRFPGMERERIIPKAGYLGGPHPAAGIKWIASFPDNVSKGLPRASALMLLNSLETGRPTTVMEGSLISGQRTAAGVALAARLLHHAPEVRCLGVVGCGPINSESLRFILADARPVRAIGLFDLDTARMQAFADALKTSGFPGDIVMHDRVNALLAACELVCFGTSAVHPSVDSLAHCPPGATLLHTSLRDLSVEAILQADNLVDDIDHVLQAQTALHRTEQAVGHRRFIRGTLADVIQGHAPGRADAHQPLVYSPFGLAALDLALAEFVERHCRAQGTGVLVPDFLP